MGKENSKYIFVLLVSFVLIVVIIFSSCKKDNPVIPPIEPPNVIKDTITISVEGVTFRSIELNVHSTMNNSQYSIRLFRTLNSKDTLVAEYPISVRDITVIDDNNGNGLQLNTEYGYYAVTFDTTGETKDTSNLVTTTTLAPTSHNYTWQEFNIGNWQSALYDVWGTDENNVWAVGTIVINDTAYGALKWNGFEWIPVKRNGGSIAIFGFSVDDIWIVGGGVFHFNGTIWEDLTERYQVFNNNVPYASSWGTSSGNMYFGSAWGKIIHWDGVTASVFAEPSTIPLTDLYGLSDDFILAAGSSLVPPGEGLIYNGSTWEELPGLNFNTTLFKTVLCITRDDYYICGSRSYRYLNNQRMDILSEAPGIIEKIRMEKSRGDIVAVGGGFTLLHYNGIDWKDYSYDLHEPNSAFYGVYVVNDYIFAVGSNNNNATIFIGRNN